MRDDWGGMMAGIAFLGSRSECEGLGALNTGEGVGGTVDRHGGRKA